MFNQINQVMKKIMFALLAFAASFTVVNAAISVLPDQSTTITLQDERVKINPEELPDAVKAALNSEDYTGWQISAAYKYTGKDMYEVELKNGDEVATVKFDKDGKKIE